MKRLVLFDWDNTIVDEAVRINDSDFRRKIQDKINEGWLIGLNSDTPFRRLYAWWKSLNMNGPIIAEKGGVIWYPQIDPIVLSPTKDLFVNLREKFIQAVLKIEGYSLFLGDNTQFINSVSQIASIDSVLIAVDTYRVCSLGLFVRRIADGKIVQDISITEKVYELLVSMSSSNSQTSEIDFNREHSYLCLNALDVNKSRGVKALFENWDYPDNAYMIGDSMSDYLGLSDVSQLAVGNASSEYKNVSKRVAKLNFAQGCSELLDSL